LKAIQTGAELSPTFRRSTDALTLAPLDFAAAGADFHTADHDALSLVDGKAGKGWSVGTNGTAAHSLWLRTRDGFGFKGGTELVLKLRFGTAGSEALPARFRVSAKSSATLEEFLAQPEEVRTAL
jgi:hypothetical protein